MDQSPQAVDTRSWTGGGTEPFRIPEWLAGRQPPRQAEFPRAENRAGARSARGSLALAAAALAVIAVAGILMSALTYRAGQAWRDLAETVPADTDELEARLGEAESRLMETARELSKAREQLAATTGQLARSEADVAQLESRLQALGTEKAKVEDEREAIRDERDRLTEVARLAGRLGGEVDACVHHLSGWLASRPSSVELTGARWADWARNGEEATAACRNARTSNDRLDAATDGS